MTTTASPARTARPARPHRVAVCSTGVVASHVVRQVLARPGFELVAVWTHDEAKAGRDVGSVIGAPSTGVLLTTSIAEVIGSRPDCVVYAAASPDLDATYVPHYLAFLEAGVNVVTVSSPGLVFAPAWDQGAVTRLNRAAAKGGVSLYASGLEPGFAGDQLVALLTTLSARITSIRVQELFRYDTYGNEFLMREVFGFGMPLDATPLMQLEGSQLMAWGPPVRYVAAALGISLDSVRETFERVATPRDLHVAVGRIAAGTAGAVRMETIGVYEGRDLIVIEHVNRMAADLAPHWPDSPRDGTYRVVIEGEPALTCELTLGADEAAGADDGMVATAMRLLNAVPYVVAAEPGLRHSLELPITVPSFA